jgi:hypothetical protein
MDGFEFIGAAGSGRCINRHSFVKASFHVGSQGRLEEHNGFSLAFQAAFERAMKTLAGLSVQVTSLISIGDRRTATGRTQVTIAAMSEDRDRGNGEAWSAEAVSEFLQHTQHSLATLDRGRLAELFAQELSYLTQTKFVVWVEDFHEAESFCSHMHRWQGPDLGCSGDTVELELVIPEASTSRTSSSESSWAAGEYSRNGLLTQVSEDHVDDSASKSAAVKAPRSEADHNDVPTKDPGFDAEARPAASEPNGRPADGSDSSQVLEDDVVHQQEYDSDSHAGSLPFAPVSVVTGAAVLATAAFLWTSLSRCRRGAVGDSAAKAQNFKGLAGSSSW